MDLVDTHCHIHSAGQPQGERMTTELWAKHPEHPNAELLQKRATVVGVRRLICVGCDLNDSQLAVACAQDRPGCWATVGVHPHEAARYAHAPAMRNSLARLAASPKVVAIGECGLDYYYMHSKKADQVHILEFQMEVALTRQLPLVFHVREAYDDFWPLFDAHPGLRGVMHSFTDSAHNLEEALKRGLFIGVNGIATFTKSDSQKDMYRKIPLEKMVLETDAPYLTPTPYRGTINEPKYIREIAEFMAKLRDTDVGSVASATTMNAQILFGV
jgi:TatD DNase family protein